MPQEKTEALVLRGVDFSETSRIVSFVTPNRGLLACMAKGVRRRNSPLAAVLDTMNRVELVYYWKDGREVQTLAEASLLDGFTPVKQNLERSTYAAFPLELTRRVVHANEPSEAFYHGLVAGLEQLSVWQGGARLHTCWHAMHLLRIAGFDPELEHCVHCGKAPGNRPGFAYEGGVTCGSCPGNRRLTAGTLDALRALQGAETQCPDLDLPPELFPLLRAYAAHQLEADFKSVRVIEEMFGQTG